MRAVDDGIIELDSNRQLVAVDDVFVALTGYTREELLGEPLSTIVVDDAAAETFARLHSADDGDVLTLASTIETADGDHVSCTLRASPVRRDGTFEGAIVVVQSETAPAEEATAKADRETTETTADTIEESAADRVEAGGPGTSDGADSSSQASELGTSVRYESIVEDALDTAPVGVLVLDDDEVVWTNETIAAYFGLDRETIVGCDDDELVDRLRDVVADGTSLAEAMRGTDELDAESDPFECWVTPGEHREGRWLERHSEPIDTGPYAGGRVELYYDVTDRTSTGQIIQGERTEFQSLVEAVEEYAIFMLDPEGHVRTWNPGAERIKGYEVGEIVGDHFSTFYTEEDRAAGVPETNLAAAAENGWVEDEGWRVRKDGSRFWANVTITAVRDDDGRLAGFAKVTRDMTERREREQAIRRERDHLERVLETSSTGIGIFDDDGDMLRVNHRFAELLGRGEADPADYELGDQPLLDEDGSVIPYPERPAPRALESGEPVIDQRIQVEGSDGRTRWLSVNATPFDGDPGGVVATMADITALVEQARRLERRRGELEAELGEVFERVDDAFYAVDEEFRFTYVNDRAEDLLQRSKEELLGESAWELYPEATETKVWEAFHTALETQDPTSFELYFEPLEFWSSATVYPSETGLSVYFRDVTERKTRERELAESERRYRTLAEHFPNSIVTLFDTDLEYTLAAGQAFDWIPVEAEQVEGYHLREVWEDTVVEQLEPMFRAVLDGEERSIELEYADREWIVRAVPITDDHGDVFAGMTMAQDITERVQREARLERYSQYTDDILNAIDDLFYVVDVEGNFLRWNDTMREVTGYSDVEIASMGSLDFVAEEDKQTIAENIEKIFETGSSRAEADILTQSGDRVPFEFAASALENPDGETVLAGIGRDVTERKRRERELEQRQRQQQIVAEFGQYALGTNDIDELMAEASRLVAETLETDYCKVLDLDSDENELLLRQGVGWQQGIVGSATVAADENSQAGYTLLSEQPVVVEDLDTETRFSGPELLTAHDVTSGISTVIGSVDDSWGILGTHDTDTRTFADEDVNFVQSIANVLATAIERIEGEQQLQEQRERLAALNSLYAVVQGITDAIIEQSSREEIERTVCERFADADAYRFAWIGTADTESGTVVPEAEAGTDDYLDSVEISIDPENRRSNGPTGRAFLTGDVQVTKNVFEDPDYEIWQETAREYDFQSSAAVPIAHEGTVFGILNVYADRPEAFAAEERRIIAQLGEIVGHAIAAIQQKRAMMSDAVVEVDVRIPDFFDNVGVAPFDGEIVIDRLIMVDETRSLIYGTVTGEAIERLDELVDEIGHWRTLSITERNEGETPAEFEIETDQSPIASSIMTHGGTVESARITGSECIMTLQLPQSAAVREVFEAVKQHYPSAEPLARRQIQQPEDATRQVTRTLLENLTDRQRTVLETTYYGGFYEWPRESTGEDLAERLDITPATFSQHLREAERKLLAAVFDTLPATG